MTTALLAGLVRGPRRLVPGCAFSRRWLARSRPKIKQPPPVPTGEEAPKALSFGQAVLVTVVGGTALGVGVSAAMVMTSVREDDADVDADPRCSCAARVAKYDTLAGTYDSTIGRDEQVMLLPLIRWCLLRSARGSVLEVAAGTGAYLSYYPSDCRVTATDASEAMMKVAAARRNANVVRCEACGVTDLGGESYDTVVDAFGLCSFDDPSASLEAMQRACKRDGVILLLEHGRSHYKWLNKLLDRYAARHLEKWGCSWNRDIAAICAHAGLRVTTMRRFHFGTTYYVIAKPDPTLARAN